MIALLIVIDYYGERLKSFSTSSTLVSLSHLIMVLCSFLNTDKILKRLVCTVKNSFHQPSKTPYAKRWRRSGGLQCPCIYSKNPRIRT